MKKVFILSLIVLSIPLAGCSKKADALIGEYQYVIDGKKADGKIIIGKADKEGMYPVTSGSSWGDSTLSGVAMDSNRICINSSPVVMGGVTVADAQKRCVELFPDGKLHTLDSHGKEAIFERTK